MTPDKQAGGEQDGGEVSAEPGPTMELEEGRIAGDSGMFGPQVIRLAEEDTEQVSILAAIDRSIAGVEEGGPHQEGLVGSAGRVRGLVNLVRVLYFKKDGKDLKDGLYYLLEEGVPV